MAAPAECASSADAAICSGVTGTCAFFLTESPEPVTAQVIKTALVNIAADFASESRISEALSQFKLAILGSLPWCRRQDTIAAGQYARPLRGAAYCVAYSGNSCSGHLPGPCPRPPHSPD